MSGLRDYQAWHTQYDDPTSSLSWRLATVQAHLQKGLDARPGPVRILSACSGDGRDVIGVLSHRTDADRVEAVLLEVHPRIAEQARSAVAAAGLSHVEVRTVDVGHTDAYAGVVPADMVLLVGILGNISRSDVDRLIMTAPAFCAPGALLLWSRGVDPDDINPEIRAAFVEAGFVELDYDTRDGAALGAVTYVGPPVELPLGRPLFAFLR